MGLITEKTPLAGIQPVKFLLNWGRRYSLWVFNFGLACCAIEFIASSMALRLMPYFRIADTVSTARRTCP